jgi:hypothetical protein
LATNTNAYKTDLYHVAAKSHLRYVYFYANEWYSLYTNDFQENQGSGMMVHTSNHTNLEGRCEITVPGQPRQKHKILSQNKMGMAVAHVFGLRYSGSTGKSIAVQSQPGQSVRPYLKR